MNKIIGKGAKILLSNVTAVAVVAAFALPAVLVIEGMKLLSADKAKDMNSN